MFKSSSIASSFCKIEGGQGVTIGENVHISSYCHINAGGGRVRFGSHSGCASHVVICGGATDLQSATITPQDDASAVHLTTTIGEYVVIFAGAVLLPGVTVGDWAVIAAGAVVTCDVPSGEIWAGVPARKIGERETIN